MPANPDRPGRNRDTGHLCAAFSCSATPSATRHRSTSLSGRASPRACEPNRYTALSGTARCIASRHRASVSRWSRSDSGSLSNNSLTPQTLRHLAVHRQARIMGRVKSSPVPRRQSFTLRKGRTRLTRAYLRWGRSGSRIPAVAARAGSRFPPTTTVTSAPSTSPTVTRSLAAGSDRCRRWAQPTTTRDSQCTYGVSPGIEESTWKLSRQRLWLED